MKAVRMYAINATIPQKVCMYAHTQDPLGMVCAYGGRKREGDAWMGAQCLCHSEKIGSKKKIKKKCSESELPTAGRGEEVYNEVS